MGLILIKFDFLKNDQETKLWEEPRQWVHESSSY